ncbi:MAG: hypothetical protein K6T78_07020 [Alicyclobacillus sp.]|nr:hypothetical protein [Alicyclobacillus sp.]
MSKRTSVPHTPSSPATWRRAAATVIAVGLAASLPAAPAFADTTGGSSSSSGGSATSNDSASPYAVLGSVPAVPAPLILSAPYAVVGDTVTWSAAGLPANTTLHLVWETYEGQWQTQAEHFIGATYTTGKITLGSVQTDASGSASGSLQIPSGFGDAHFLGLVDDQGNVVAAGSINVAPRATITTTTEPQGAFFHIHVDGMGVGPYTSDYDLLYDNHLTGNVTAVTSGGQADFTVRAEGGVGLHTIQLVVGGVEGAYLNAAQSPFSWRPNYTFDVEVTPGHPKTVSDPLPALPPAVGNHLHTSVGSGTVGSSFTLTGTGLTPNHTYEVVWNTMAGSRVSGNGYQQKQLDLGPVTTDANGDFSKSLQVPNDLGGPAHTIQLLDGQTVAGDTTFRIYPSLVSAPATVTAGQAFTVELHGVGWTEYDNTYAVDYDNSTIGYVCGFNSQGDVKVQLVASGTPGFHYVDLYPSIYKGQQTLPYLYGIPLLTYQTDHPGDNLPAIHVVVDVLPPTGHLDLQVNGKASGAVTTLEQSGQTYVSLWDVMQAMKRAGWTSTSWNGTTWNIQSAAYHGPAAVSGSGPAQIEVNGRAVLRSDAVAEALPGGLTTFLPLSTVTNLLNDLDVHVTQSGSHWTWTH